MRTIETERLVLRRSTAAERDTVYRILVQELEGEGFTRDDFDAELQFDLSLTQQPFGQHFGRPNIFRKADNRYVGFCPLMPRLCTPKELSLYASSPTASPRTNTVEAELGWAISDLYRSNGYATEAARGLIEYGFCELHLPRILAFTTRNNVASIRVMEKLGMRIGFHPHTEDVVGMIGNDETWRN